MSKDKIITHYQTHPSDLATVDDLKLEGLQPADGQPVAALFNLRSGDCERLMGLFRRSDAVPLRAKEPVSVCPSVGQNTLTSASPQLVWPAFGCGHLALSRLRD